MSGSRWIVRSRILRRTFGAAKEQECRDIFGAKANMAQYIRRVAACTPKVSPLIEHYPVCRITFRHACVLGCEGLSTTCAPLAARQSRSCCPSSRVCLTCPERIGHTRGIVHLLPAKITKLRRPSRPLIARMRATGSANSSMALSRATH